MRLSSGVNVSFALVINIMTIQATWQDGAMEPVTGQDGTMERTTGQNIAMEPATSQDVAMETATEGEIAMETATWQDETMERTTEQDIAMETATGWEIAMETATVQDVAKETATGQNVAMETARQSGSTSFRVRIGLSVVLGMISVLGIGGNGLILAAVGSCRFLHTIPNVYIGQLAVADLLICTVVAPATAVGYWLPFPATLCKVVGHLGFTSMSLSLVSMTLVAINRFVLITQSKPLYMAIYSRGSVVASIALSVCLVNGYTIAGYLGYGEFGHNAQTGSCSMTDTAQSVLFLKLFGAGLSLTPAVVISALCYLSVVVVVRGAAKRAGRTSDRTAARRASGAVSISTKPTSEGDHSSSDQHTGKVSGKTIPRVRKSKMSPVHRRSLDVMRKLFVMLLLFFVSWAPLSTISLLHRPSLVYQHLAYVLALSNSAMNFAIYCFSCSEFRRGLRSMFAK